MEIAIDNSEDIAKAMVESVRIAHEIKGESDRGVVLVVAAFLDEQSKLLIARHFIDDSKVGGELLSQNGPLGTFASRIKLAYCLDLISQKLYSDLNIIRKIRNEFAHSHRPASFESDRVRDLCGNLKSLKMIPGILEQLELSAVFDDPESARNQFVLHALGFFTRLMILTDNSAKGIIDMTRFVERDMAASGGENIQRLLDEYDQVGLDTEKS